MELEQLEQLNKKFAEETTQMNREFNKLFQKWLKKSPRLAIINSLNLPINLIMHLISSSKENFVSQLFPELPDVIKRFLLPFITLKGEWGKIPDEKFELEYRRLYELQFGEFFASNEERENFKNWFEGQKNEKL